MQVSVIIPTYNSARFLTEAVDSVLSQTFKDIEILVIDDGSTDETEGLMHRYGSHVRYIRQENSGVARARNRGIQESRGHYVAFLDADDTWLPHKLECQLRMLDAHGGCYRLCYSDFIAVTADLRPLNIERLKPQGKALEDLLLRGNVVGSICTVLCERSLFNAAGGFDFALSQCADWDMWVRLACLTDFLYINEQLVTYRRHGANMSRNAALLEHDSLGVLNKGFSMPNLPDAIRGRRRAAFARNYMVLAGTYFQAGCYGDFSRCAARAVAMDFRQAGRLLTFPVRLTGHLLFRRNREVA